jgi:hypothetical protein
MLPRSCADIDRAGPQILGGLLQDQLQTLPRRGVPVTIRVLELAAQLVVVCSQHLEQRQFSERGKEPVLERRLEANRSGASSMNPSSQPSA